MILNERSEKNLVGVHPQLVRVVRRAAEKCTDENGFVVTEGVRTLAKQKEYFAAGKSQTMKTRHLTGHAVDLAVWEDRDLDKVVDADEISWKFPAYKALADLMKQAAAELGIPIEWGGDWISFKDGPHFQLPWTAYP